MKIRTLIADDEVLARGRVRRILSDDPEIELVAEARNGMEAVAMIEKYEPDLVVLDIEMPDFTGFEVLRRLKIEMPYVVFVTAFDAYAVKAFDVHAIDYVLKPYDNERFANAILQVKEKMQLERARDMQARMLKVMNEYIATEPEDEIFFEVKHRSVRHKINATTVRRLEADGNYVKLFADKGRFLLRETLQKVEQGLPKNFFRVHRSAIVNAKFVSGYKYLGNNRFCLQFESDEVVETGRSYRSQVEDMLSKIH